MTTEDRLSRLEKRVDALLEIESTIAGEPIEIEAEVVTEVTITDEVEPKPAVHFKQFRLGAACGEVDPEEVTLVDDRVTCVACLQELLRRWVDVADGFASEANRLPRAHASEDADPIPELARSIVEKLRNDTEAAILGDASDEPSRHHGVRATLRDEALHYPATDAIGRSLCGETAENAMFASEKVTCVTCLQRLLDRAYDKIDLVAELTEVTAERDRLRRAVERREGYNRALREQVAELEEQAKQTEAQRAEVQRFAAWINSSEATRPGESGRKEDA